LSSLSFLVLPYFILSYLLRIDGLLFINLTNDDWPDMGIVNKFHAKKLSLILKSYRSRYQRRLEKKRDLGEDDDVSDYAPSELSDLLAQASGSETDADEQEDENNREISSTSSESEDEQELPLTEEERIERMLDKQNMKLEVKARGDGENYPMIGDVVRVRYTCTFPDGKLVSSTKHSMGRESVEFVLGIDQVVKAFDRALPQMSIGERSLITATPEYGYGRDGLYALIPPDTHLIFDITLLGFRPRELWIKPLIQEPGYSEKPYIDLDAGNAFNRGTNTGGDDGSVGTANNSTIGSASISKNSMI
jgi:FK506-binding protein 1